MQNFWQNTLEFWSLSSANVRYVLFGSVLLTAASALVGCFTFLRKKALVGDAVAHAILPGICIAFLLQGTKVTWVLLLGAFATGWLGLVLIEQIVARSKIKQDTAIGLVLSVFFGVGILLLTHIQRTGNAAQSGLNSFLFGKAAALVGTDLMYFSVLAGILLVAVLLFYKEFMLISFDRAFAKAIGMPIARLDGLLTMLTVLAVVLGIQAVGVVLMAAMLITPAATARFWTNRLPVMLLLAAVLGAISGASGAFISYTAPAMPTGPWIVVVASVMAIFSFFLAPGRGIVARLRQQRRVQRQILHENVLKLLYKLSGKYPEANSFSIKQIMQKRGFKLRRLQQALAVLKRQGYVQRLAGGWQLTAKGQARGRRVVKLHRLWEVYLTQYLRIAPDHVHDDAETMEHVITPELEAQLEQMLQFPEKDPHNAAIPYA